MGNPDFATMQLPTDAISVAAPAWHTFVQGALDQPGKGDERT